MPVTRAAVIHAVTTRAELVGAFAQMYPAVWDALHEQGPPQLGEVIAVYHSIGDDELVLSAGMEVDEDFEPLEPLALLELGGCEAGVIDHFGPYLFEDFRRSQATLEAELALQSLVATGLVIERYLTMPDAEPDQSKWHTEIWLPLA
ncbi:MAG: GyrI-like domain-containing protein [Chloroflexi bacterium]|nr:GyrI-like domain-containing protein [Chloroflexota bacterium]MCY3589126.1 GyrI-like domain-containing protein [Chloroflexota bacterium]MCY3686122.1 GyrI-like domain-containing protein [Chloroflexota bacterium]